MKLEISNRTGVATGRPPRGGRGLKSKMATILSQAALSPPSRGAWIEICSSPRVLARGMTSPPSRGAWIEIMYDGMSCGHIAVAPLAGGVD